MALAIRLRQQGRKNHTVYRVVVIDSRSRRDGRYLEAVGWYNPLENEADRMLSLDAERIQHWLGLGAQMTTNVERLVHRGAPVVIRQQTERLLAHKAKACAKRKVRKVSKTSKESKA